MVEGPQHRSWSHFVGIFEKLTKNAPLVSSSSATPPPLPSLALPLPLPISPEEKRGKVLESSLKFFVLEVL
jgi:hypothetical protein